MMNSDDTWNSTMFWSEAAEQAWAGARRRAMWEALRDRLKHRRCGLVPFEEIRLRRGLVRVGGDRVETVPLDRVVGSVGKSAWFTRSFHPLRRELRARWKRAYAHAQSLSGFDPVELYEVEGEFFVVDGHFRISVARSLGSDAIEAVVRTWVPTAMPTFISSRSDRSVV